METHTQKEPTEWAMPKEPWLKHDLVTVFERLFSSSIKVKGMQI